MSCVTPGSPTDAAAGDQDQGGRRDRRLRDPYDVLGAHARQTESAVQLPQVPSLSPFGPCPVDCNGIAWETANGIADQVIACSPVRPDQRPLRAPARQSQVALRRLGRHASLPDPGRIRLGQPPDDDVEFARDMPGRRPRPQDSGCHHRHDSQHSYLPGHIRQVRQLPRLLHHLGEWYRHSAVRPLPRAVGLSVTSSPATSSTVTPSPGSQGLPRLAAPRSLSLRRLLRRAPEHPLILRREQSDVADQQLLHLDPGRPKPAPGTLMSG